MHLVSTWLSTLASKLKKKLLLILTKNKNKNQTQQEQQISNPTNSKPKKLNSNPYSEILDLIFVFDVFCKF